MAESSSSGLVQGGTGSVVEGTRGARVVAIVVSAAAAACGVTEPRAPAPVAVASSALTAEQRLAACAQIHGWSRG